jgi:hypothetical protein
MMASATAPTKIRASRVHNSMVRSVRVIKVPYDSGHHEIRMGRGPGHILESGVFERLAALGHEVVRSKSRASCLRSAR